MKPEVIRAIRSATGGKRNRERMLLKLEERIEDVKTPDGLTHWMWRGTVLRRGRYPDPRMHIWVPGLAQWWVVSAKKLAFAAFAGKVVLLPDVLVSIPECKSGLCINPLHYSVGTMKDVAAKRKGRPAPNRILSFQDAEKIRGDYKPYSRTKGVRALARKYGVNRDSVSDIVNGRSYRC